MSFSSARTKSSAMTALLFALLASPQAFAFTNGLGLVSTVERNGAPSTHGLLLHAAVFFAILYYAGRQ